MVVSEQVFYLSYTHSCVTWTTWRTSDLYFCWKKDCIQCMPDASTSFGLALFCRLVSILDIIMGAWPWMGSSGSNSKDP